jgi:hypothetical protein
MPPSAGTAAIRRPGTASDRPASDPEADLVDLPLRFVGIEFEGHPRGQRRVLDASGRHCDELRLYRWRAHRDGDGHDAERDAVLAGPGPADRGAGLAAGARRHMVWVQVADSMR